MRYFSEGNELTMVHGLMAIYSTVMTRGKLTVNRTERNGGYIIPETVGQYTGLTDKNGKKIFEGDILSGYLDDLFPEEESRYEVIWHDYGWHIRSNGFLDTPDNGWLKENFEVIGNIHDNPELLKGSAKK